MGCRMEIYTDPVSAEEIIALAAGFGVDARIIGRVEQANQKSLDIHFNGEIYTFTA